MLIPVALHLQYVQQSFTENEFAIMERFINDRAKEMFHKIEMGEIKLSQDNAIWKLLVELYDGLSDGKKTKVFIYQIMVLNGIIDDGVNGKETCNALIRRNCNTRMYYFANTGDGDTYLEPKKDTWSKKYFENICCNMSLCLRIPYSKLFTDINPETKFLELDDRILRM